ncbi:hypothetical protein [Bartonella sp. HY406]|uniref:hypothetical protein n=1 Tax=Bartonella sp. HY406 TaxID=2979331 RepID=UPI0021C5FE24|nr:hypothetical protein [Bartonella sp. HY406]UXN04086.1 hypothetical protein N6B01_03355 [Bartonella sp. HY406]
MSTDYFLHIKTSDPSVEDYNTYTYHIFKKYKILNIEGIFFRNQKKRKTSEIENIKYPNNLNKFKKEIFIKDIKDCELKFWITFNLDIGNDEIYLRLMDYRCPIDKYDYNFNYTIAGGNVRFVDVFSFIDVTSSIFVDEKFIWGCLSYDIAPRLEDYYIVFLKKDIAIDLPLRLASNIFDEDKYINLGDVLSNGINMYVHKNYSKFLNG